MIEHVGSYPRYRDSGVPWLGEVPAHWDVKRNKLILEEVDERSKDGYEELLSVSQYTGITPRRERQANEGGMLTNAASLVGYKRVMPRDLVINIMLAWNGSLGVSPQEGIVSTAYCVFRVKAGIEPRFLHYLFRTPLLTGVFKTVSTGVVDSRLRLYPDVFLRLPTPLPPIEEQFSMVRFLDHADRRIRRYIAAKRKLIALLNEQKQAIIHHAVTHGLDRDVPLKPSGVDWLGDVPKHWQIKRLKWVTRLQRGYDLPADQRTPGPYPVVSSGGLIDTHSVARAPDPGVVLGRYGSTDAVFFVESEFWPHNTALFVTSFQGNRPRWCYFMLRAISKADHATKSAVPGVDRKDLFDIVLALPPVDEQDAIARWLDFKEAEIAMAIKAAERQISLAREYLARLTADVVTGKVDVRNTSTELPDEDRDSYAKAAAESDEPHDRAELDAALDEGAA